MKVSVEWGILQERMQNQNHPCPLEAQFVAGSIAHGIQLAGALFHTLAEREPYPPTAWNVNRNTPRKVLWNKDCTVWVSITILDGKYRGGPYSGVVNNKLQQAKQAGRRFGELPSDISEVYLGEPA